MLSRANGHLLPCSAHPDSGHGRQPESCGWSGARAYDSDQREPEAPEEVHIHRTSQKSGRVVGTIARSASQSQCQTCEDNSERRI